MEPCEFARKGNGYDFDRAASPLLQGVKVMPHRQFYANTRWRVHNFKSGPIRTLDGSRLKMLTDELMCCRFTRSSHTICSRTMIDRLMVQSSPLVWHTKSKLGDHGRASH